MCAIHLEEELERDVLTERNQKRIWLVGSSTKIARTARATLVVTSRITLGSVNKPVARIETYQFRSPIISALQMLVFWPSNSRLATWRT